MVRRGVHKTEKRFIKTGLLGKMWKKALLSMLIVGQFGTLTTPLVAYAEEGDEAKEPEENLSASLREGNVYAEGNSLIGGAFETATEYDPYVHYITTYNTLVSRMNQGAKTTPYAEVYKGNEGEALKGTGSEVQYDVKNTDATAILTDIEESKATGEESSGDALEESPAEDLSESELQEEISSLEESVANAVTDSLMGALNKNLSINLTKDDLEYHAWKNHGYNSDMPWMEQWDKKGLGSGLLRPSRVRENIGNGSTDSSSHKLFRSKLNAIVKEEVSSGRLGLSKQVSGFTIEGKLGKILKDAETAYSAEYKTKGVNTGWSGWYGDDGGIDLISTGNNWVSYGSFSSWDDMPDDAWYLVRTQNAKDADAGRKITESSGMEFIQSRYMWTYENVPMNKKSVGDAIVNAYNGAIGEDSSRLKSLINDNAIEVDEGIRTLAWTPIYPKIVAEGEAYDGLQDRMEAADSKSAVDGDTFTYTESIRTLQGMDLFLDVANHSPVLIGARHADKSKGSISALHLGSVSGEVDSGANNTKHYVWYGGSENGKAVKIKAGFHTQLDGLEANPTDIDKGITMLGLYTSAVEDYSGSFLSGTAGQNATIGADNYGNVINGETGEVLVPYWQNHMFPTEDLTDTFFPYSPMIGTYGEYLGELDESFPDAGVFNVEGMASSEEIEDFIGEDGALYQNALTMKEMLESKQSIENSMSVLENGYDTMSQEEAMRALAVVISASTEDSVKSWNTAMREDAKTGGEMYINFEPLLVDKDYEELMDEQRWSAASLIQKFGWIMDYGFADVIRLTIVSNLTRTYNSTIGEAGLEYIFYTDTITNSEGFSSLIVLVSTVLGAVLMGYLLLVGFKAYRGDISWSKVLMKAVVLAGVLFYPMFVYGNLVEYAVNKPTGWIMGSQMRLSVVLDTYFAEDNTSRNVNEFYENMFGTYADSDSMQMGSYNVTFYTTTDKDGFDINEVEPEDTTLSLRQRDLIERYQEGRIEYPKDRLVSVSVPLTDLYKWVWDVRYRGEGLESETYGRDSDMPSYDEVVGAGTVEPLFQWLAKGGSSYFGVEGYDEALASYDEYKIMPMEVKPQNNISNTDMEAISTYGSGVLSYRESTNSQAGTTINEEDMESNLGLEVLTGSELFYEIVENSSNEDIDNNLGALTDLSSLATIPEDQYQGDYIPTDDDIRALIRDLSNTSLGREYWYGDSEGWSDFTRSVLSGSEGTGGIFIDSGGVSRTLQENPNLTPPTEDFLGLTHIVEKYKPNRDEENPYKRRNLEEDVSEINEDLLENYLSTYSIAKSSLGADEDRNGIALDHAEKMVMSTEAFFQFNDALGWNHFPRSYAVDSIKFDKYMALLFIPFKDYGKETMTFYDDASVVPMTTAEYIGMNESPFGYFLFIGAVLSLVIFGMFYLAVLHFGLLVFSMYNFVKYYVIKSDYQNKSALGSVIILLIMSGAKMALMLVIWFASWYMNKTVATSSMNLVGYPTTLFHSLAVMLSVVGVFMFVIRPVWKGVINDRENMGGQFFTDKASDFSKKIRSGGFLPGRGSGVRGGSQASKFQKGNKKADDGMKNNAGRLGSMDEKGLNKARKQAGGLGGGSLGIGGGSKYGANTRRSVVKVREALNNQKDKLKGIDRAGRKPIDTSKVKASNLIERAQLSDMGRKMNGVVQTASGLAVPAVKGAMAGQQLSNFQTGVITTMALGSAGAAAVVAKNLMDKGIKARTDGNNVLFDSSGYDLADTGVRSELFNNSVADLQNQNVLKHANVDKGKVDGSTAINYDYSKGDERIGLTMDSKTGIHPETFNQLANSQEFKELFIKPRAEELTYDRKGNVVGLPVGGLRLVNPQMSASEVQNKMNNLYKTDNHLRKENNLDARDQKDMSALKIDGMDESYYNEHVAPIIKNQKGMYTQGSRVVYNSSNPLHQTAMRNINKEVKSYNKDVENTYGNESNNIMRYVMKDGDNQGVVTNTVNGDDNQVLATMLYGDKNYKQNVSKYKVDESEIGIVGDNVQAVNQLRNISTKGNTSMSQTVNEFTKAKKDLRNILNSEVKGMSSSDRVVHNQEMMDYLNTTQVSNSKEFKSVKSNMHDIGRRFKQQEISEEQYHELVRRENNNLMKIMDANGKLDGFILNRYDTSNPYIKKYEEQAMAKNKSGKKGYKTLKDRYNQSVDKLDKEVGRKNLMEMPLGVVESSVGKSGEEYQLDGKGVLIQRTDSKKKRNSFEGKDKDAIFSYLMKRPLDIKDVKSRKLGNN